MSYQALSSQEDDHAPPQYNGSSHQAVLPSGAGAAPSAKSSIPRGDVPSYLQAVNYVHVSDVGDIIGIVYNLDTDKPPAYGRFDSQEEQAEAPQVYLSAKDIQATIRLSGSKRAKIEIHGCQGNQYGRTVLRIVDASKTQSDGTPSPPTRFTVNFTGTSKATALIAVPSTFSGSITGACSLSGHIRDEAICLVADAKKSRWTVRQDSDLYNGNQGSSISSSSNSQYPPTNPNLDLVENADNDKEAAFDKTAATKEANEPEHSSISFSLLEIPGLQDKTGNKQRSRRHVVFDSDYGIGLTKLEEVEREERGMLRKALAYYGLFCIGWTALMFMLTAYFEGPPEVFWALTLFPLGVSIFFPVIVMAEGWGEYFYKPPITGSV